MVECPAKLQRNRAGNRGKQSGAPVVRWLLAVPGSRIPGAQGPALEPRPHSLDGRAWLQRTVEGRLP